MRTGAHDQRVIGLHGDHQIGKGVVLLHVAEAFIGERVVVPAESRAGGATELLHGLAHVEDAAVVVGWIGAEHAQRSLEDWRWIVRDRQARVDRVPVDVHSRVPVLEQIDERGRAVEVQCVERVNVLHVVQLVEVVEHRFPVAVEQHGLIGDQRHARQVVRRQPLDDRPDVVEQWRRVGVHADEHQTQCGLDAHRLQRSLGTVDGPVEALVVGHHDETSIGPV